MTLKNICGILKKYLTCTTVLSVDKILIVISLSLLDLNGEFETYKAISIPLPLPIASTENSELSDMVATYNLETPNFIINIQRTSYALLYQRRHKDVMII